MAQQKLRDCISRARASASRKVNHYVLFHLVDTGDGLQPVRLQEWDNAEDKVADQIESYAADHALEYRIAQQYKLGAYEDGADDKHPFASVNFKQGAGNELNGETHPPNERGMLRQNMAHTEFAIRFGMESTMRATTTVERVLTTALQRETSEAERWRTRAIAAENKLEQFMQESVAERESAAKAELERLDTQHKVATRQRLADEAIKMFPLLTTGFSTYLRKKWGNGAPKELPAKPHDAPATDTAQHAPATDTAQHAPVPTHDAAIVDAVLRLCGGITQEEMVKVRMAVSNETWQCLEDIVQCYIARTESQ